jgi:adenosylcobyric acid synthase
MAYAGVLPFLAHGLPDEDGAAPPRPRPGLPRVCVIRYPTASNLDEFKALEEVADVVWAGAPADLDGAALVVLPGSKHVAADLAWLRERGFAERIATLAARSTRILGICGGLQMLGDRIDDPAGVDGNGHGLGLLPLRTRFDREKRVERVTSTFPALPEPWAQLTGASVAGYEIRHGAVVAEPGAVPALPDGRGYVSGPVLGVTLHGVLESPEVAAALVGRRPDTALDMVFDELADVVEEHLDLALLERLAGVA